MSSVYGARNQHTQTHTHTHSQRMFRYGNPHTAECVGAATCRLMQGLQGFEATSVSWSFGAARLV